MLKANDKIKVHIYGTDGKEIQSRNMDAVFTVQDENGKLGIDYNTEKSPHSYGGNVFTPFEAFSYSVIFENVENGKKYHWSNANHEIVESEE